MIIFLDKTFAAMKEKTQMNNTEKFFSFSEEDFDHVENIKKQILVKLEPLVGKLDVTKVAAQYAFIFIKNIC